jgi:hypothetical protein
MSIVLDVDGVILDFSTKFANHFNDTHDANFGIKLKPNPSAWNYELSGKECDYMVDHLYKFIDSSPTLNLLDNMWPEYISALSAKYAINIVTAYPNEASRIKNLELHKIKYSSLTCCKQEDKVAEIIKKNPQYVFEDCPAHIEKLSELLPNTKIFVPSLWNYTKGVDRRSNIILYDNLTTAIEMIPKN